MNKSIKNKLLHFYTSGNIYDDFAKSRTQKTVKLRQIVRVCFYVHCAAAVLCIILAAVLRAGLGTIAIAVFEVLLATLAFLAVGDMTLMKTLLYCGDILFAASMFIAGALNEIKTPFFVTGAISIVTALVALGSFFAAMCKIFLESFSPLAIRREHYTLLPNFDDNDNDEQKYSLETTTDISISTVTDEEEKPDELADITRAEEPPEPPRSEFQLLADRLKEVFHSTGSESAANNGSQ